MDLTLPSHSLFHRLQQRQQLSEADIAAFLANYEKPLWRWSRRWCVYDEDRKDLVSQARLEMIRLLGEPGRVAEIIQVGGGTFKKFLKTVAHRLWLDFMATEGRAKGRRAGAADGSSVGMDQAVQPAERADERAAEFTDDLIEECELADLTTHLRANYPRAMSELRAELAGRFKEDSFRDFLFIYRDGGLGTQRDAELGRENHNTTLNALRLFKKLLPKLGWTSALPQGANAGSKKAETLWLRAALREVLLEHERMPV